MKAIKSECIRQAIDLPTQIAYVLVDRSTMKPTNMFKLVTEALSGDPTSYGATLKEHHRDYYPYYGPG